MATPSRWLGGIVLVGAGVLALSALVRRATADPPPAPPPPAAKAAPAPEKKSAPRSPGSEIEVPPPPFTEGVFPCTSCHEKGMEVDTERRELSQHDEIKFEHDPEHRWCLDCHDVGDRDQLRLASGLLVPFTESYKLCGQCHGDKARDWRAGVHGRRTGHWDGTKKYLLCVHCHSPHSPKFRAIKPDPAPRRPLEVQK